ncbi:hypothetical protein SELMODRAFT_439868 [Selaginella moellendorffii]|uniref:Uncharacterized protein n=1 Tax=Selaginella moellendorffii TaxID=88036 RepID=D8R7X0_SELML|nr:subtilisin-like protease SBT4.13 isoform X1 [Selaginella moellendorffii]EFJ31954.1 hypothetical protein SELMODRAFT_439868 [Selaginella moellendorffii]|eukprot:XP_002967355.1 subtilisin-like protease SBT4.13 isoform X1 [Selaginella moellendorffii]
MAAALRCFWCLLPLLIVAGRSSIDDKAVYVVYMGSKGNAAPEVLLASQQSTLMDAFDSEGEASSSIIYSYKHAFSGFSATLTREQAAHIADMPGVVSVFRSRKLELHTTQSWQFLGLTSGNFKGMWEDGSTSDVIVGVLDTGIWPESESFRDHSMGPVPERWKGECENDKPGLAVRCNRKIVGARSYFHGAFHENKSVGDYTNARDGMGHGTHTASTIAGRVVDHASLYGLCEGKARGGLPKARIAVYKVCFFGDCMDHSVLAAFDDAVHDGVDMLSVSLGGQTVPYDEDTIAIGSFHAMRHGILVSCSAGNSGPFKSTVTNVAPWILTVGASSTNRRLVSSVQLGNNETLEGTGLNVKKMKKNKYGLVNSVDAALKHSSKDSARLCLKNSLDSSKVKDKIVLCHHGIRAGSRVGNSSAVLRNLGAAGLIQVNELATDVAFSFALPSTLIQTASGERILSYINSTTRPTASILPTRTLLDGSLTPVVAVFSSRGPSDMLPEILKPDIIAPGLNILASWSPDNFPIKNVDPLNNRGSTVFNILSGTSMSCPHATGAAAYVKSLHPDWSPSMIKSALMTTATSSKLKDYNGKTATPFDYGAGEINPIKASDPGLVYDISTSDYVLYLCSLGYNSKKLKIITGLAEVHCKDKLRPQDLNYPTITIADFDPETPQRVSRTATNVGPADSTYTATVNAPRGINVTVAPRELKFGPNAAKLEYTVRLSAAGKPARTLSGSFAFGDVVWSDGVHSVRSTITVGFADM